ncbi:MAG TPA: DUF1365 domain-containing protein [Bacteroidia bacterium]|nr:DUF1365 domain-containing protein [Bacteroidia bacterium]
MYKATVMHHRLEPKKHKFHYDIFMFYIDLDELELLQKKLLFYSNERFNFFSLKRKEHLQLPLESPDTTKSIKQQIKNYLLRNGIDTANGRIMLLTNLNVLGYNFNPVSFYYCFDEKDNPLCALAEVGNTFGEMKPFLISKDHLIEGKYNHSIIKHFYVSPFIDHDSHFEFSLTIPAEKLNIRIDDIKDHNRFFISTLTGIRKDLNNINLLWYSIRFPFITLKIITLIHWNALKLWLKKIPYYKKNENQHLQQNVYRRKE